MKRWIITSYIFLVTVFMVFGQKIVVKSPSKNAKWCLGKKYTISWKKSGTMSNQVRIHLFKGGSKVLNIKNDTTNDGSQPWTVPNTLPTGTYVIRIFTLDKGAKTASYPFKIVSCTKTSITITSPPAGKIWFRGKTYNITWTSTGISENVRLKLYKGGSSFGPIIRNTTNDGSHPWTIPATLNGRPLTTGSDYKIRIETVSEKYSKWSDKNFTISSPSTPSSITVTSPPARKIWFKGKTHNIAWTTTGSMDANVNIALYKPDLTTLQTIITRLTTNDGNHPWTIPADFTSGYYIIRVKTTDGRFFDNSSKFRISGKLSYQYKGKTLNQSRSKAVNTKTKPNPNPFSYMPKRYPDLMIPGVRQIVQKKPGKDPEDLLLILVRNIGKGDAFIPEGTVIIKTIGAWYKLTYDEKSDKNVDIYAGQTKRFYLRVNHYWLSKIKKSGRHPIILKIDPKNVIKESREDNNEKKESILIKRSDLIVEKILSRGPYTTSQLGFKITIRIKNIGDWSTMYKIKYKVLAITGLDNKNVTGYFDLKPGETRDYEVRIFPKSKGLFWLTVGVDPNNNVNESNENNNIRNVRFNVK